MSQALLYNKIGTGTTDNLCKRLSWSFDEMDEEKSRTKILYRLDIRKCST